LPGIVFGQAKPVWLTATHVTTGDGFATLRWSVEGDGVWALFRISENHSGERQISFTDQAEIRVFRSQPGEYNFWVQACKRYADGYAECGAFSPRLSLSVSAGLAEQPPLAEDAGSTSRVADGAGVNSTGERSACRPHACN